MRTKRFSLGLRAAFAIVIVTLLVTTTWAAPREKVLHNFNNKNGANPVASLIFDSAGNLYGTTFAGGNPTQCTWQHGCGTVFELMPQAGGGWLGMVLRSFNGKNGLSPSAGLILDSAGNLYGTTMEDAFELMPKAGGGWKEKVLHDFVNGRDGQLPVASLVFDSTGSLYGTTELGIGKYQDGTVFELSPRAGGGWKEKVLHSFSQYKDGTLPSAGLIFDATGNLYGTVSGGGKYRYGTVFELSPTAGGGWTETVLHSFNLKDGAQPMAGLIFDAAGNLYGTTAYGGKYNGGTVFELSPQASGGWTEKVLHNFIGRDGDVPYASLVFDAAGNLYGTTEFGGNSKCQYGCGTVFELMPKAGGGWKEKVLHSFNYSDGAKPAAGLIFDAAGNLYGTTSQGGASGHGTVFEIIP